MQYKSYQIIYIECHQSNSFFYEVNVIYEFYTYSKRNLEAFRKHQAAVYDPQL